MESLGRDDCGAAWNIGDVQSERELRNRQFALNLEDPAGRSRTPWSDLMDPLAIQKNRVDRKKSLPTKQFLGANCFFNRECLRDPPYNDKVSTCL